MAGLGPANVNQIRQYIPIAVPDTTTYPGCDFYNLGVIESSKKMHPNLAKPTQLRGYYDRKLNYFYMGPMIVAKRGRPVRLLMRNILPANSKLFLPVDTTVMGAGMGPSGEGAGNYSPNRTAVHLHGGFTPWISDGTPHQWFTPQFETTSYKKGVSFQNVPDMIGPGKSIVAPSPGDSFATYYYTNDQSARLMFYHDHSYGLTRLNVYAGMAAPYLLTDDVEDGLINSLLIPGFGDGVYFYGIPLIIQDKTFVPKDIATQDNKWNPWRTENGIAGGLPGDLWLPHVYEPNQDPTQLSGASLFGRWDYGPWFWPIVPTTTADPPGPYGYAHLLPGMTDFTNPWVYNKSIVPEAFMDTMLVNGTVYPYVEVQPRAYRLRILNACNDRNLNVQMYVADTGGGSGAIATATVATGMVTKIVVSGGTGYTSAPSVYITGGGGSGATATAALTPKPVASIAVTNGGSGYPPAPTVTLTGGGGTGATATATAILGVVTGINDEPRY